MPAQKKPRGSSSKKSPTKRPSNPPKERRAQAESFPHALADLLRSKKIPVPKGLLEATPQAYAGQPVSFIEQLGRRPAAELKAYAEKIATFAARQDARARSVWDSHPLIVELRRRKLKEPKMPARVIGVAVSMARPLKEWTDKEILRAVDEWVKRSSR
jgi:hypothetical protein